MPLFNPFNVNKFFQSESIPHALNLEKKITCTFREVSCIDFKYGGNTEQFKFLFKLADSELCNRNNLVLAADKYLSSPEPLTISRYARAITKAVSNGILSLERKINDDLLTPSVKCKYGLNLGHYGAISSTIEIGIGSTSDSNDDIKSNFFGARFNFGYGSYFYDDNLSEEYKKWLGILLNSLSCHGIGFMTLNSVFEYTYSWYYEQLSTCHAGLGTELDLGKIGILVDYINNVSSDNFSLQTFCELHAQMIVKKDPNLSSREFNRKKKHHSEKILKEFKGANGSDYSTYTDMVWEVLLSVKSDEYHWKAAKDFEEKNLIDHQGNLSKKLDVLFESIPEPVTEHDSRIYEYIDSISDKIPDFNTPPSYTYMESNESHMAMGITICFIPEDLSENAVCLMRHHQEGVHEADEPPFSFVKCPNLTKEVLKEQFCSNAILTSIACLASEFGVQDFY